MLRTTTYKQVVAATTSVVSKKPEYVYQNPTGDERCLYVHPSASGPSCGCLVGTVLHDLGVSLEVLVGYEGADAWNVAVELGLSDQSKAFLYLLQGHQDNGVPWGQALELVLGVN